MSGIKLVMCSQQAPITWEKFLEMEEKYAIALDGYVSGGPRFDSSGPRVNFNHHEEVDRLATRSTCGQVLMAIRQGLFKTFRNEYGPYATVLVNDCDEDVSVSWYLLKHHAVCEQAMNPLLNRLVMMEDHLDATAGAYPFPADLPVLRELAWVFEPYRQFRLNGQLDKKDPRAYTSVVEDVEGRIGRHIIGQGQEIPLDLRYERIGGGKSWTMVREIGAQARQGMFAAGIQAYVSVRQIGPDNWAYVVGRMSPFIPFDCQRIFDRMNLAEKGDALRGEAPVGSWGGSDIIGGSPRINGSRVNPVVMEMLVHEVTK